MIKQSTRARKVLKELIRLFDLMLGFERRSKSPDYDKIKVIQTDACALLVYCNVVYYDIETRTASIISCF